MDSKFLKDFDTILNEILVDYRSQVPDADTSVGSLIYIKSACQASALWGAYRYQEWISNQIFSDTADPGNMEHHAWIRGILRRTGETDDQLLARYLDDLRRPPAGGNHYDYPKWALEVDNIREAYCVPNGQGIGSVDVIIVANNETGVPDQALIDTVFDYIEDLRPAGMRYLRVLAPVDLTTDVTMQFAGTVEAAAIEADVTAYLSQMRPGEDLILSQLSKSIMTGNNLDDLVITTPGANIEVTAYQRIIPGVIDASEL